MAALLVGLSVMAVLMSMAFPVWSHMVKREKEEELIWRGQQYARAVGLFQRKYANAFPPSLDVLVEQKFLRKKYKDPITNDDFQLIPATGGAPMPGMGGGPGAQAPGMIAPSGSFGGRGGAPPGAAAPPQGPGGTVTPAVAGAGNINLGISGVVSKSKASSIKIYNGRQKHNEWAFVYLQTAQAIGGPGSVGGPFPGMPGQPMPGGNSPFGPGQPGGRGSGFSPFGPGPPGMPGGRGMPPLPPGRGFEMPSQPGGRGQPMQPFGGRGQPGQMQPFGIPPKPPGN